MNALEIVGVCAGGAVTYFTLCAYVYLRLLWHFTQRNPSTYAEPEIPAAIWTIFLPIGLGFLILFTLTGDTSDGLPPRRERQAIKAKAQQKRINELERELDLIN